MTRCYIIIALLILFSSCSSDKNFKKPTWLLGKWVRTNNEAKKTTYEFWNDNFTGIGFTLQEKDTTFIEKMSVFSNKEHLYFQVTGIGEQPTFFTFTQQTKNSFTVEKPQNQFPKKIKYSIENDTLKAVISNNEFAIDFKFVKLQ